MAGAKAPRMEERLVEKEQDGGPDIRTGWSRHLWDPQCGD